MALLEKAKSAKDQSDKGDDAPKKHKKVKHPASTQQVAEQPEQEDTSGGGAADEQDDSGGAEGPVAGGGGSDSDSGADESQDQGEDQAQGPPQGAGQQQGNQGGTPVPNPQAPGAGVEEGGEDTPDNEDQATGGTPDENAPSPAGAPSAQGGPAAANLQQVPMTPAMKEEYQNLDKMLLNFLYQQGVAEKILPSLFAQGPYKLKGAITASVTLAREVFLKAKAPLPLALPFARDVAAHVLQIGEQVKSIQYSDQEFTAIFSGVYEGMLRAFGVKRSQAQHMQHLLPRSDVQKHAQAYTQAAATAKAAAAANGQQPHSAHMPPPAQPAQAAGPQGPQGAGPPSGMLAQGAAASAQGAPEGSPAEEASETPQEEAQEQANG